MSYENELFAWNDQKYGTGVQAIDEQHKDLVELLNKLHRAVKEKRGMQVTVEILDGLIQYTAKHFAFEEELMKKTGYPGQHEHLDAHSKLVNQVLELRKKLDLNKVTITFEVLQFLSDWLNKHICGSDREFGEWFSGKGYSIDPKAHEAVRILKKPWWKFW